MRDQVGVPSVNRAYPRRPYACFDEDGKGVDLHGVLEEIRCEATECARQAARHLSWKNMIRVADYKGLKPSVAGSRMGIRLPPGKRLRGRSRFERMVREYAGVSVFWPTGVAPASTSVLGGDVPLTCSRQGFWRPDCRYQRQTTSTIPSVSEEILLS